jgi:hypothetical protein
VISFRILNGCGEQGRDIGQNVVIEDCAEHCVENCQHGPRYETYFSKYCVNNVNNMVFCERERVVNDEAF